MNEIETLEGLEAILPIRNTRGELIAIVYNDVKRRSTNIYGVKEYKLEEMKALLETIQTPNEKGNIPM